MGFDILTRKEKAALVRGEKALELIIMSRGDAAHRRLKAEALAAELKKITPKNAKAAGKRLERAAGMQGVKDADLWRVRRLMLSVHGIEKAEAEEIKAEAHRMVKNAFRFVMRRQRSRGACDAQQEAPEPL